MNASHVTRLRLAHGWTQTELARRLNTTACAISRIENGFQMTTAEQDFRLAVLAASAPKEPPPPRCDPLRRPYRMGPRHERTGRWFR